MNGKEIISILRDYKSRAGQRYGIKSLGLFGSLARGEGRDDSDVDVVIEFNTPNLVTMSRIRIEIEELTSRHVDIVHYRDRMNQSLKKKIDREAIYV